MEDSTPSDEGEEEIRVQSKPQPSMAAKLASERKKFIESLDPFAIQIGWWFVALCSGNGR